MTTEDSSKKIVILAFNLGLAGHVVNGPGISLRNLIAFISRYSPNLSLSVFTKFPVVDKDLAANFYSIRDRASLLRELSGCDVAHCWSGLDADFAKALGVAESLGKPVILGPNLLDSVNKERERSFLSQVRFRKLLTANPKLKYRLQNMYNLRPNMVEDFMVGPDTDLWTPPSKVDDYILWKGNGAHKVKDVQFAKKIAKKLPKYNFVFMGDNRPYIYLDHVERAKSARLFINTSLSETKGMAQLEQMAAGVPSVTHPDIFCHGISYETGIVTSRSLSSYIDSIQEILENDPLRMRLREGSVKYVRDNFDPKSIVAKYVRIIHNVV